MRWTGWRCGLCPPLHCQRNSVAATPSTRSARRQRNAGSAPAAGLAACLATAHGLQPQIDLRCSSWPPQFAPTREGFLRFMVESKVVYDAFEDIMQQAPVDYCERGAGLVDGKRRSSRDLLWGRWAVLDACSAAQRLESWHPLRSLFPRPVIGLPATGDEADAAGVLLPLLAACGAPPTVRPPPACPLPWPLPLRPRRQAAGQHRSGARRGARQGHCPHAAALGHGVAGGRGRRPGAHVRHVSAALCCAALVPGPGHQGNRGHQWTVEERPRGITKVPGR